MIASLMPDVKLKRRGMMLVMASPSGAGKTSITRAICQRVPKLHLSISCTTRAPRHGEEDGKDYYFVSEPRFEAMVKDNEFLEYAKVFNNHYGTPRSAVEEALSRGEDVVFDIDWQGTQQLKHTARNDVVSLFVLPPSYSELRARLIARGQDSDAVIHQRMDEAAAEMSHWAEYDYIIINKDFDTSVRKVEAIIAAERLRRERLKGLSDFVRTLKPEDD